MIKADLKHWGGRRSVKGPYEIDYKRFVKQSYNKLGEDGLVGVPNARGPDNSLDAEFRFEELYNLAKKFSSITSLGDGRVFHDDEDKIWFVKSQEINSRFDEKKLTYLVYNIPFGKNFNEENNEAIYNPDTIKVLTLPSCIEQIDKFPSLLFNYFSGIIVHSSSATILPKVNERAEKFYNTSIKGKLFGSLSVFPHSIGAISVSGGHRSSKESLIQKIISPVSVGSSYTPFQKIEEETLNDFNYWLKNSIENSQDTSILVKGSIKREMLSKHFPRMFQEILSGRK